MTGHDVRTIMSTTLDMMTARTGSPDIMSGWADLRKHVQRASVDMMTGSSAQYMIRVGDLRKRSTCHRSVGFADIMSNHTLIVTASSGRRSQ